MENTKNVFLTGIPRSGTTLCCYILNQQTDHIALVEPLDILKITSCKDINSAANLVLSDSLEIRRALLDKKQAVAHQLEGKTPVDVTGQRNIRNGRDESSSLGIIHIDKQLTRDFQLIIKHPTLFTALLPSLATISKCFAVIRNPVSVLSSWNSSNLPVKYGLVPAAQKIDSKLNNVLEYIKKPEERQLIILEWFFTQISQNLSSEKIIRYEDVISSHGNSLKAITGAHQSFKEMQLNSMNKAYSNELIQQSKSILKKTSKSSVIWEFYPYEDCV